jgi:uncharacterized protein YndB with AHSA1/START domain
MPDIKMAVSIDAPPGKIFPLIATPRGLSAWWAADVTENAGAVDLGFFKRATIYRLQLARIAEPSVAEWRVLTGQEWAGTRIVFELAPNKSSTVLRFAHAGWQAETEYFSMCTATWGELMFRLKSVAEGNTPGPLFTADALAKIK